MLRSHGLPCETNLFVNWSLHSLVCLCPTVTEDKLKRLKCLLSQDRFRNQWLNESICVLQLLQWCSRPRLGSGPNVTNTGMEMCSATMWSPLWQRDDGELSSSNPTTEGTSLPSTGLGLQQMSYDERPALDGAVQVCWPFQVPGRSLWVPQQNASFLQNSSSTELWALERMCRMDSRN